MACCLEGCPCPTSEQCGGLWKKIKEQPCCVCPLDSGTNCATYSKATPHRNWKGCCECECDPEKGGQTGSWSYTYDEDGKPTDRSWSGECKQDGPSPDWDSDNCKCYCKLAQDGCENSNEKLNTDNCKCECTLTAKDCTAPTPVLDSEACECVECDKSPGDCPESQPSLDSDKCECYCQYDDPNRGTECPEATPTLDADNCTCKCDVSEDDCSASSYFDSDTCSCKPCSNVCQPGQTYAKTCQCVGCTSEQLTCDDGSCIDPCPPSTPSASYVFDSASCSCNYTIDVQKLIGLKFIP